MNSVVVRGIGVLALVFAGGLCAVYAQAKKPVPEGFVRIPGGTFTMGSPANEANRGSDEVQHQVTVGSFYMGKHEVTQQEYEAVMGTNPSFFKGPNLPVEMVSWFDAVEYCNKCSQWEGLSPAYTISGSGDSRSVAWNRGAPADHRSGVGVCL